eukprot:COSAG06_NODE_3130_length_5807_cov_14.069727_2_plen_117_part_00
MQRMATVRKTPSCEPFYTKNDPFCQDRLGTNIGKALKIRVAFFAGARAAQGKKTAFLSHLYIKMMILPRQARDNHRENSKKVPFSRSVVTSRRWRTAPLIRWEKKQAACPLFVWFS